MKMRGMGDAKIGYMIENLFIALWIIIFALLCAAIKRSLRKSRSRGMRALRRLSRENFGPSHSHRQAA
jgi:hypothetical protein